MILKKSINNTTDWKYLSKVSTRAWINSKIANSFSFLSTPIIKNNEAYLLYTTL